MPGGVHASVSCPLLHPLWPYPLRPLLYRVSSRSRERPNKLDRTGDCERAARFGSIRVNTFFAAAIAVTLVLMLIIWLGPRVLLWLLNRFIDRYNKVVNEYNERQEARHAEIRTALDQLQQAAQARRDA
ncbi:Uncharacterised protein [Mycobacteroides abscessus subsp. massiliense]|nr:hypothetical protein PROPHIGD02-2_66 [Mycobacterium phage prophiGD02-2]QST87336.1 hypothetical protein PROPHIGD90-1_66 [Mycobacterium phage prophiGD90-1]CPR39018.1 Uncharacterised protein [Mycobacteroides abscessus]SKD24410.1 Uncharacterised protein [Mycobacteroides abscessus subsp. massiliense]CPR59616.1 Uncharacterised protein [Mycobacteroides abscessus]